MAYSMYRLKNIILNVFKKEPDYKITYLRNESKELNPNLAYATDVGKRRKENQDSGIVGKFGDWTLLAVADGVASTTGAKIASTCALAKVCEYFKAKRYNVGNPVEELKKAIRYADSEVKRIKLKHEQINGDFNPPKTTIVMALVNKDNRAYIAWVGDSRAYTISENKITQLTRDDSWVMEALEQGMAMEDALKSPMAHAITQCLGMLNKELTVHVTALDLNKNGLLLCSDGLWNYFNNDDKMLSVYSKINGTDSALEQVKQLIECALTSGGGDNVTVAILKPQNQ